MKRTLLFRIKKLVTRNCKRIFSTYAYKNYAKWKSLKDKYRGETIVLIGNGPSLNETPLYLLKGTKTIVFNRFDLMIERLNWLPYFYMVNDGIVGRDIQNEIEQMIKLSHCSFFPDICKGDNINFRDFIGDKEKVLYFFEEPIKFSNILPWVGTGNTVIFVAFQILKYMGFSKILFCGVDLNYVIDTQATLLKEECIKGRNIQSIKSNTDNDVNHFDPRYFGKGRVYHQPTQAVVDNIFQNLKTVDECTRNSRTSIINIGYNSNVEYFSKQDFRKALGISCEKEKEIFEDLVKAKGFKSLDDFIGESIPQCSCNFPTDKRVISTNLDLGKTLIKSKIIDYLPIGPFEGKIFFIKRDMIK